MSQTGETNLSTVIELFQELKRTTLRRTGFVPILPGVQ